MMNVLQELLTFRSELQSMTEKLDDVIAYCSANQLVPAENENQAAEARPVFENVYSLCMEPGFFKGKAAVAVIFPDGVRIETPTWKALVEVVMKRCNDDAAKHAALMELRNRVQGRSRQLLGNSSQGMRSPLKIDQGLYMESHYDTESLLRIMKTRVLDAVGYDYTGIRVAIRNA